MQDERKRRQIRQHMNECVEMRVKKADREDDGVARARRSERNEIKRKS